MLQVNSKQKGAIEVAGKEKGDGSFNYRSFHLGDWPEIASLCAGNSGTGFQAPINIAVDGAHYDMMDKSSFPKFYAKDGGCEEAYFEAKDTAWQVNFVKEGVVDCTNLMMEWKGRTYTMLQFHFHTLSEDTIDFQPTAMQMHMVHVDAEGNLAVFGVMIKTEGWFKNHFLEDLFKTGFESDRLVTLPHKQRYNPYKGTLEEHGALWYYEGSLTTPPCLEGVDFLIGQTPVSVSQCHVTKFMDFLKGAAGNSYGQNHRPIQPLNDRVITTGRWLEGEVPACGKLDSKTVQLAMDA